MKFPFVLVEPDEQVYTSPIPANYKTFLEVGEATNPVPLGAGTNLIWTEPHFPWILVGTVWALPIIFPQYPLLTGVILVLANAMAPFCR